MSGVSLTPKFNTSNKHCVQILTVSVSKSDDSSDSVSYLIVLRQLLMLFWLLSSTNFSLSLSFSFSL